MDSRNNPSPVINELTEEAAKLFCNAKRDDQTLVIAFQSGVKVGRIIGAAGAEQKQG